MQIEGRTGIVTGVEGPYGAAIVRALAQAGARLLLASPDPAAAAALGAETGQRAIAAEEAFVVAPPPPDLLIDTQPLPDLSAALGEAGDVGDAFAAAARGFARLSAAAARMESGGAVLVVSATPGATAERGWLLPFLAWRAAAVAELARELAPRGVRVNGLAPVSEAGARLPGFLKRGPARPQPSTPLGRAALPEEVAEAALWLLGAEMVTGLTLPLDGGRGL
jgi:3-oxoacyl-[acyl-carrier protein] reductase